MTFDFKSLEKLKDIEITAIKVEELRKAYSDTGIFEFFQLRPKGNKKIELVSFLPHHPMRGIELTINNSEAILGELISRLTEHKGAPLVENNFKYLEKNIGFPARSRKTKTYREDDVQAAFCLQQLRRAEAFEGIQFVTTEFLLVLENKRIDVLGIRDSTLYIFELKKDRDNKAYSQVSRYKTELESNMGVYFELLRHFPNIPANATSLNIETVAVMPWSKRHRLSKPDGVSHWLYEIPSSFDFSHNLIFHKG